MRREWYVKLRRCILSLNHFDWEEDIADTAICPVVFITKGVRLARAEDKPGHVHLLCQMNMLLSRHNTHASRKIFAMFSFEALIICLTCQYLPRYVGGRISVKTRHLVMERNRLLAMTNLKFYGQGPPSCGFGKGS
jgi:hypothetical protein